MTNRLCRQKLLPTMRQTQKGDTEFDMSVSVLSATGELQRLLLAASIQQQC